MSLRHAIDGFENYVSRYQAEFREAPGIAVALTDRVRTQFIGCYGYADVAERIPVSSDTSFYLASIGKTFTAVALMQLVTEGRVDLHAPVSRYLPWFNVRSSHAPITLHHLMTHTAGIIAGSDFCPASPYEVYALRDTEVRCSPGEFYHYSNVGYKSLGFVIESLLQQSYGEAVRKRIIEPLRMENTDSILSQDRKRAMAIGYESTYSDSPAGRHDALVSGPRLEVETADGSIVSTIDDMTIFSRMLLNGGTTPDWQCMSPSAFGAMRTRHIACHPGTYYGYGLHIEDDDSGELIGHGGHAPGFRSAYSLDCKQGIGVAVFSNGVLRKFCPPAQLLRYFSAAMHGNALPSLPSTAPHKVSQADEFSGTYIRTDSQAIVLTATDGELMFASRGVKDKLEPRGPCHFFLDHPVWRAHLFHGVQENHCVTVLHHGARSFYRQGSPSPSAIPYPGHWDSLVGHYRSHNPWDSHYSIIIRQGQLLLLTPEGQETALVATDDALRFRLSNEPRHPEWVQFSDLVEGLALVLTYSTCAYYRTPRR